MLDSDTVKPEMTQKATKPAKRAASAEKEALLENKKNGRAKLKALKETNKTPEQRAARRQREIDFSKMMAKRRRALAKARGEEPDSADLEMSDPLNEDVRAAGEKTIIDPEILADELGKQSEIDAEKAGKDQKKHKEKVDKDSGKKDKNRKRTREAEEEDADADSHKKLKQAKAAAAESDLDSDESGSDVKASASDDDEDDEDNKLEIDVDAAEPPSRKAKRQVLKEKKRAKRAEEKAKETSSVAESLVKRREEGQKREPQAQKGAEYRSEYGVWIGNLPWTATKEEVRAFFADKGGIDELEITRCYMPWPRQEQIEAKGGHVKAKAQNRGFAYVDFSSPELRDKAITLSDTLMTGRKVLIKDSKSFEGRPEEHGASAGSATRGKGEGKPPSQRIFVGNLGFDVSRDDLVEHFSQAGEIEDVHMATFEDTGKCKGFAWVRFKELEAAEHAVRGFIRKRKAGDPGSDAEEGEDEEGSESDEGAMKVHPDRKKRNKAPPKQKWWINRLRGRQMRCEFAEDAQTRYKKRYHKDPNEGNGGSGGGGGDRRNPARDNTVLNGGGEDTGGAADSGARKPRKSGDKEQRRAERAKKHVDARTVAPGKALAGAQRNTGAIVQAAGKKVTFD